MSKPTVVDLFAGAGGMTSGFVAAGFKPVLAVEWDLHAAATYAANFGEHHMFWGDIADLPNSKVPRADVVIGGPPCQGFSNLGARDPLDPRNKLWLEYMRVVLQARPKVFVLENVDRFASSPEFALLKSELDDGCLKMFEDYDVDVLNAADYGVPQRRNRTILIASSIGKVELPDATHSRKGGNGRKKWLGVQRAIGKVPEWPETTALPSSRVSFFGQELPGTFKSADLHIGRQPTQRSLDRYDCIPPGGGRFDLPDHLLPRCWAEKPTGTTDVMGRMQWDMPSLTIRTEFFKPEKGQYLHPQWDKDDPDNRVNRPITHREAALIQTFPSRFEWCGTKIQIAKQIGNAVPPRLAQVIATTVLARLQAA